MSIHIPNWDDFQHADVTKRGNAPAWIKNYTRLLSDDNYLDLTPEQRALLHGIWIEYARSGKKLSETTTKLARKLNMRVTKPMLVALNQAGFIEIRQDAVTPLSSLEEKRREEREEKKGVKADRSEGRALSADKQNELNRILELTHDRDAGSWNILYDAARGLPFAALAKVRESCLYERSTSGRVGVGYAVNALRSEPRALRDAASFADFLEEEAS